MGTTVIKCQLVDPNNSEWRSARGPSRMRLYDPKRLARLCNKAIHERNQARIRRLLNEILELLAARQNGLLEKGPQAIPRREVNSR